jgi:hypothetical protein
MGSLELFSSCQGFAPPDLLPLPSIILEGDVFPSSEGNSLLVSRLAASGVMVHWQESNE